MKVRIQRGHIDRQRPGGFSHAEGRTDGCRQARYPGAARPGGIRHCLHRAGAVAHQKGVRLGIAGDVIGKLRTDDDGRLSVTVQLADHAVDHPYGEAVLGGRIQAVNEPGTTDDQYMIGRFRRLFTGLSRVRLDHHAFDLGPLRQCAHLLQDLTGQITGSGAACR